MAKNQKTRVSLDLSEKQVDNILRTFGVYDLVEYYLADQRVLKIYNEMSDLFYAQYPDTMACVNEHVKTDFFKDFTKFKANLRSYFKRTLTELVLEEFASTAGNVALTTKRIRTKELMFFTQRLHIVYEELSFNIKLDKVLNGQQTVDWLF